MKSVVVLMGSFFWKSLWGECIFKLPFLRFIRVKEEFQRLTEPDGWPACSKWWVF